MNASDSDRSQSDCKGMTRARPNRLKSARPQPLTPLATARELADLIGVSTWTIYSWANKGVIPCIRLSDRILRFNTDAVLAALSSGARR